MPKEDSNDLAVIVAGCLNANPKADSAPLFIATSSDGYHASLLPMNPHITTNNIEFLIRTAPRCPCPVCSEMYPRLEQAIADTAAAVIKDFGVAEGGKFYAN